MRPELKVAQPVARDESHGSQGGLFQQGIAPLPYAILVICVVKFCLESSW